MRRDILQNWGVFCAPLLLLSACSAPDDPPSSGRGGANASGSGGSVSSGGAGGNATGGSGTGGNATGGNASGGTANGGSINTGGSPPDGGPADRTGDDAPACSAVVAENEVVVVTTYTPIDLYFMVDKSGSMTTADVLGNPTRWAALSSALGTFVDSSATDGGAAGLGMGLAFFPVTGTTTDGGRGGGGNSVSSCNVADYARAIVDIAPLPPNAAPIKSAVGATTPNGGTPTLPALRGAVQYATAYQAAHTDRKVAIVLATDGQPNDCSSTVANVAAVAATAYAQTPPLATYVLGIGPSTGNLDTIAAAGGTQSAYMVTASGTGALLQALNAIRTKTQTQSGTKVACTQKIPPPTGTQSLDYAGAIITTIVGTTSVHPPQVMDAAACGGSDGWYYDDAAKPTAITFCPATCSSLSPEAGKSRVTIEIPCLPIPPMPPH